MNSTLTLPKTSARVSTAPKVGARMPLFSEGADDVRLEYGDIVRINFDKYAKSTVKDHWMPSFAQSETSPVDGQIGVVQRDCWASANVAVTFGTETKIVLRTAVFLVQLAE